MPTKRAEGGTAPQFPGGGGGRYDFFVSYTAKDRDWAEWIAWHLEAAGWSCVLQAWDFFPGDNFVLRMREAADQAERTLAVASKEYFQSRFASTEWAAAFAADPDGRERKLVIASVKECQPPKLLRPLVRFDLFDKSQEQARSTLLEQIQRVVSGGRAKPHAQPPFPAPALPAAAGATASFRAAVIGVAAEVGPALAAVAERLGRTPGIITPLAVVDAATGAAPEADVLVALVGRPHRRYKRPEHGAQPTTAAVLLQTEVGRLRLYPSRRGAGGARHIPTQQGCRCLHGARRGCRSGCGCGCRLAARARAGRPGASARARGMGTALSGAAAAALGTRERRPVTLSRHGPAAGHGPTVRAAQGDH